MDEIWKYINNTCPQEINRLVLVVNHDLYLLNKVSGIWHEKLKTICYYGENGFSSMRKAGDKTTPVGLYKILYAFGTESNVKTNLSFKLITNKSYFCDDDESKFYNSWVESDVPIIGEHLIDYPKQYHYGLVFDFNMNPTIKGLGSSIFLHCKGNREYTAGCIAIEEKELIKIINDLTNSSCILIIPDINYCNSEKGVINNGII